MLYLFRRQRQGLNHIHDGLYTCTILRTSENKKKLGIDHSEETSQRPKTKNKKRKQKQKQNCVSFTRTMRAQAFSVLTLFLFGLLLGVVGVAGSAAPPQPAARSEHDYERSIAKTSTLSSGLAENSLTARLLETPRHKRADSTSASDSKVTTTNDDKTTTDSHSSTTSDSSETTSSTSTPTPTSKKDDKKGGMSSKTRSIVIGVTVGVGSALLLIAIIAIVLSIRRHRIRNKGIQEQQLPGPVGSAHDPAPPRPRTYRYSQFYPSE